LGSGLKGLMLHDICVVTDNKGKPFLELTGSAKKLLDELGANKVHLSLSHETEYAIAYVVLENLT